MTTPTPRIPLNEPQTEAGRAAIERHSRADYSPWWDHEFLEVVLAIEREAQAIPLIDVDLLARAMRVSLDIYGWDLDGMAATIAAEYDRLASESSTGHNEGSCDLCTGWHDAEEAAFMNLRAALPVKEGEPE